jgi:hypothetical protein
MAKLPGKSRKTVSRRLPAGEKRRGLQKHVKLAGEVIWAWNELHLAYAFTFVWAADRSRSWIGQAIWTALGNDGAQRDILEAILPFLGKPGFAKRLRWALKETGHLARYRNDVVHGSMIWETTDKGLKPKLDYFGNPMGRILRYVSRESCDGEIIEGPDLQKLMVFLRGDLMQLAAYVHKLSRSMVSQAQRPLPFPRKPQLQAREFAQAAELKARPPKRRQGRGNRPKSSPA